MVALTSKGPVAMQISYRERSRVMSQAAPTALSTPHACDQARAQPMCRGARNFSPRARELLRVSTQYGVGT